MCRCLQRTRKTVADTRDPPARTLSIQWAWPTIAVGIGFVLGGLSAAMMYRWNSQSAAQPVAACWTLRQPPSRSTRPGSLRSTACLWDGNSMGSREIGSGLTSGESLHCLEGLAEFKLNWSVSGRATFRSKARPR